MWVHDALRNILREIISVDKKVRDEYVLRAYKWYFGKLGACGALSDEQKDQEDKFINPEKHEKLLEQMNEEVRKRKLELENEDNAKKEAIQAFWDNQRTIHKEIPPAKDRIQAFHRKQFHKNSSMQEITSKPTSATTRP